jgi:hypothetical protein
LFPVFHARKRAGICPAARLAAGYVNHLISGGLDI